MEHSDLKVGMKVKRVNYFNKGEVATSGRNVTVKYINHDLFSIKEDNNGAVWDAEYFEPIEETKEKETMNTESNLISLDKKYKTRCGYPVRILCVDRKDTVWPVVAMYQKENCEGVSFHKINDGTAWNGRDFDLIEVSPYEDFKKDDKVMVSEDGIIWYKRYFSHATVKGAYVFDNGNTSWTEPNGDTTNWPYCRKPTQEELGK